MPEIEQSAISQEATRKPQGDESLKVNLPSAASDTEDEEKHDLHDIKTIETAVVDYEANPSKEKAQIYNEFMQFIKTVRSAEKTGLIPQGQSDKIIAAAAADSEYRRRKLDEISTVDAKTHLLNERGFDLETSKAIIHSLRTNEKLICAYFDLDGFKGVNDLLGHDTADEVLRQVAALLRTITREDDIVARLHGDEFAVLFKSGDLEKIYELLATFRGHNLDADIKNGLKMHYASEGKTLDDDLLGKTKLGLSFGLATLGELGKLPDNQEVKESKTNPKILLDYVSNLKQIADTKMKEDKKARKAGR